MHCICLIEGVYDRTQHYVGAISFERMWYSHEVGHSVYYDCAEVAVHIRTKLKALARG